MINEFAIKIIIASVSIQRFYLQVNKKWKFELFVIPESGRKKEPDLSRNFGSGQRNLNIADLGHGHLIDVVPQVVVLVEPTDKLELK